MNKLGNKGLVRNEALTMRIVNSVKEGKPYSQIAKEEGVAASTVCRHFKTAQGVTSSQYHASRKSKNCQMCGKFFKPLTKRSKVCPDKECKRLFTNWQADQYRIRDGKVRGEITRDCDFCGKTYTSGGSRPWGSSQEEGKMYRPKYCSDACAKKRAHQVKLDKYIKQPLVKDNCIVCGAEFTTNKPNSRKRKKTCSKKCASTVRRARQYNTSYERKKFTKQCLGCGNDFNLFAYSRPNGEPSESGRPKLYCTNKCFRKNHSSLPKSKEANRKRKKLSVDQISDGYIVEQIQKQFRRSGGVAPSKSELMEMPHYVEARRNLLKLSRFRTDIVSSRK